MGQTVVKPAGKRDEVFWRATVTAWSRSGLSQPAFCTRRKLSKHTFRMWLRLLRQVDPHIARVRRPRSDSFLPVKIVEPSSVPAVKAPVVRPAPPLAVCLKGERRVLVPADFDESALRRVVLLLEALPC